MHLGLGKPNNDYCKAFLSARCNCLVRFLGRRGLPALFFENEAETAVSVNGLRYRTMNNEFLWPEWKDMDVDDVCFQQDGATCHTSGENIGLMHEKFPGRAISRKNSILCTEIEKVLFIKVHILFSTILFVVLRTFSILSILQARNRLVSLHCRTNYILYNFLSDYL